jgi:hypothetical protein
MPNFGKDITPQQTEAIRAYLTRRALDKKAHPLDP